MWGGWVQGCLHGFRGVWVFVGLATIELGRVFEVEREGDGVDDFAKYCG